ncbi:MAG: redoxin domain-containing protein [Candidatus Nomurabacteria bacterium]|nr:redoxin domain-containing protein [Candidatus Nomurabacteria bacterium]
MDDYDLFDSIHIGDELDPEMTMKAYVDDQDRTITLADYEGKWKIFVFYPGDFTFVCPTELAELAEMHDEFKKEGAEIFSISTDSVFVHKAWHDQSPAIGKVKYPMVADPTGELSMAFGTYIDEAGESLRGTFIIDPDNVVRTMEINHNDIGRSAKETLRKLRAAKFVREHGGNVCPASWEPGDDTLEPNLDLVGKI